MGQVQHPGSILWDKTAVPLSHYRRYITAIIWLLTGQLFLIGWIWDAFATSLMTDKCNEEIEREAAQIIISARKTK